MKLLRPLIAALLLTAGTAHAQSNAQLRTALVLERTALMAVMLDNPAPSVAFIAIGGGMASFVAERMDPDTRTALQAAGVGGVLYCLFNAAECDAVFAQIVRRGTRIHRIEQALRARGITP